MSDREYIKKLVDLVPEDRLKDVIEYVMSVSDGSSSSEEKLEIVSEYILGKYRPAFEKLAK